MVPQFVKGYVKSNQNDDQDAEEAIGDAVGRANMRFVAVKTVEQQDLQAMHRIRPAAVKSRTALLNQMRGLLGEYGVVVPTGVGQMRQAVPELLEAGENRLSALMRSLLAQLYEHLQEPDTRIRGYKAACQRLVAIEGIGPLTATAVLDTFGDGRQFPNGRQFAAALGRVPRQHGSGGKLRLLGISKRGDRYARALLVHGARSVVGAVLRKDKQDARSCWIRRIVQEHGFNRAAVAVANKNARIIWALLTRQETYRFASCTSSPTGGTGFPPGHGVGNCITSFAGVRQRLRTGSTHTMARPVRPAPFKPARPQRSARPIGMFQARCANFPSKLWAFERPTRGRIDDGNLSLRQILCVLPCKRNGSIYAVSVAGLTGWHHEERRTASLGGSALISVYGNYESRESARKRSGSGDFRSDI